MMYKIEIVELLENDTRYPTENKVYEQKIPNLNVEKVVLFLNTKHNFQNLPVNIGKLTKEDLQKQKEYIAELKEQQRLEEFNKDFAVNDAVSKLQ